MKEDFKLDSYTLASSMTPLEVLDLYQEGRISRRQYEGYKSYINGVEKGINRKLQRESGSETIYAPMELGVKALQHILDNGGTHKEALEAAMEEMGKTIDWLELVKNKSYGVVKETLHAVKEHPERKVMEKNGSWNQTGFKRSPTVNALSKQVSQAKRLSDTLEDLKASDKHQQEEIDLLKQRTTLIDAKTNKLGVVLSDDEQVELLFNQGYKPKQIIESTGISKSRVYRILEALKRDS
jgi:prefoldin subunit 5